jgi:hypothetical protein
MEVGFVRIADESDFARLKDLCLTHDGWSQVFRSNVTNVWTRQNDVSDFNMIKIRGQYSDVNAAVLYDVLHDPIFRKTWDPNILDGQEICRINDTNDIGYYAMKLPKPLANRDFVTQRSWLDNGAEKFILNHSVSHASMPPKRGIVRGVSYMTGYYIVSTVGDASKPGCQVTYLTQADPKGRLPSWVVNKATQWLAPKVITKLHHACQLYEDWKKDNRPLYKPWLHPEQNCLPYLDSKDIVTLKMSATDPDLLGECDAMEDQMMDDFMQ